MWNWSLAVCFTMYLLQQIRAASSFGGELLILIRHKMDAQRKFINSSLFATQIKDTDLGVGDTTAEPRFRIRLVLTVTVTSGRATTHFEPATIERADK